MPRLSLYLDECVRYDLVEALRKRGFVVTHARDERMANREIPDDVQLNHATVKGWTIVTYNGDEFGRLHREYLQQGRNHGGIIIVTLAR